MPSQIRLSSVVVVCNVRAPYSAAEKIFGNFSTPFCTQAIPDIHAKFYGYRPRGPIRQGLNVSGVGKYSDVGPIGNSARYGLVFS